MSRIVEIMKAVEGLNPVEFLKLRSALDKVEEKLWTQELRRVSAKRRNAKLTDAGIDELARISHNAD